MQAPPIRQASDLHAIARGPYADFMPHATVLDALEASAQQHAQRPALACITTGAPDAPVQHWTHAAFIAQVRRAARAFLQLAGDAQPRVAFLLPATPQAWFTLWGAEAVGVASPINYLLGEEHIAELIDAGQVNILVALGPHAALDIWSRVPGLRARCATLRHVVAVGPATPDGALDFDALLAAQPDGPLPHGAARDGDARVALFHTGGTTGRPKLAQHTHRNQLHAAWGAAVLYGASERDVILNGFPLFHVAGAFVYGLSILLAGGCVVLPPLLGLRDAEFMRHYWQHVARQQVSLLATVPTVISSLLGVPRAGEDLSRVRCLLTGGSPLPTELAEAAERQLGVPVRNILGMTECGGVIAIEPAALPRTPGAVGLPLPFTEVVVVDADGQPVLAGVDGVLRVRGPHVGPGYTEAAHNAGVFLAGGWLVTGDIGHVDDQGRVFVTGRAKDLIIRSSHNIDPVVIEDALLRHPAVLMAGAVGAPDEYAGEVPVAYVALRPGSAATGEEIAAFAQPHIPERPAWPKVVFVLDSLPVTAIGKLFKPALRARAVQWVVEDRLARNGLGAVVRVEVDAGTQGLVVTLHAPDDEAVRARLRGLMGAFALRYEVQP